MPAKRDLITVLSMVVGVAFVDGPAWPFVAVGLALVAFGVYTGVDSVCRVVGEYVQV